MSEPFSPTPFADVNLVLDDFRARIQALLRSNFVGMYLVGSLALGDFDPSGSDIDFVVVTDTDIRDNLFDSLQDIHAQFAASGSPWAGKIEAIYVPRSALRHAAPNTSHYPQIEKGTRLFKAPLESGWVFQCVTIRDRGVVVAGPDPRTLVGSIDPQAMRSAAAEIAGLWLEEAQNDPTWLPWLRQRDAQTFVILTLCRLLYSLATESVASKPRAARWAQKALGEPWTTLIERTLAKQHEASNIAQSEEDETLAFIQFTLEQSKHSAAGRARDDT
jgi:aminoglycoside adenylyltransferase-like protein/nucleotidyltransferase-like protein